jgi:hypothetical protein
MGKSTTRAPKLKLASEVSQMDEYYSRQKKVLLEPKKVSGDYEPAICFSGDYEPKKRQPCGGEPRKISGRLESW